MSTKVVRPRSVGEMINDNRAASLSKDPHIPDHNLSMRINKYLARSGVASRRQADNMILQGKVEINGKVTRELGIQVDAGSDIIKVDGKVVSPEKGTYYLMLNKPAGYLVSAKDPHHKNLITKLLKQYKGKVFPVGRLDYDSSGLLLFTNDGQLAFRLSHPRFKVDKTYEVICEGKVQSDDLKRLREGIMLKDGMTAPAEAILIKDGDSVSIVKLIIHEGRKRQVKRMFGMLGHKVVRLRRIAYGNLVLGNLAEGKFRLLNETQLKGLKKSVGAS